MFLNLPREAASSTAEEKILKLVPTIWLPVTLARTREELCNPTPDPRARGLISTQVTQPLSVRYLWLGPQAKPKSSD